jgi:hypothetical protein
MNFVVTFGNLRPDFKRFGIIVNFRYHRVVCKYMTKGNKPEIQVEDIERAVGGVMKNGERLRYAAVLFVLNWCAALWGVLKGR